MWGGAAHVGQGAHVWVQDPQVGECREGSDMTYSYAQHPTCGCTWLDVGKRDTCKEM